MILTPVFLVILKADINPDINLIMSMEAARLHSLTDPPDKS